MFFPEALLHWMQGLPLRQPLNRRNLRTIRLHSQNSAGFYRYSVHVDGTGPTQAGLAPHMRTRQSQLVTQVVHQEQSGLDVMRMGLAIHRDGYVHSSLPEEDRGV